MTGRRLTRRELALMRHAEHRGMVILATGDRGRLLRWTPTRCRVLVGKRHHTFHTGDVWPLCVCGDPVDSARLDVGDRLCEVCLSEARTIEAEVANV